MAIDHTSLTMKRTTIWLTPMQISKLNSASKTTGIKVAELIRRFVDEGLSKKK
jgi:Ribbon-helix-helix domain